MSLKKPGLTILALLSLWGCPWALAGDSSTLEVVPSVDLARYAGKWYEIARLPNRFEEACRDNVTATYSPLAGGLLKVVNECRKKNGEPARAEGKARPASRTGPNSRLEVSFAPAWLSWLPLVWGDYWIIRLAPDYSYALVGAPSREYLWILSRTPEMDEATYRRLVEDAATQGFDTARLVRVAQSRAPLMPTP